MNGIHTTKKKRSKGKPHIYRSVFLGYTYSSGPRDYFSHDTLVFCHRQNALAYSARTVEGK